MVRDNVNTMGENEKETKLNTDAKSDETKAADATPQTAKPETQQNSATPLETEMHKAKMKKDRGKLILAIVVLLLAFVYVGTAAFFHKRFFFGSSVNGVSSSGASAEEVVSKFEKIARNYELTITNGKQKEILSGDDVGLSLDMTPTVVAKALKDQNGFIWPWALLHPQDYQVENIVECDESLVKAAVKQSEFVNGENVIKTEDATYELSGDKFEVRGEVYGTEIKKKLLRKAIMAHVDMLNPTLDLRDGECYVKPTVTADDPDLHTIVDNLNAKLDHTITYTLGSKTRAISPKEMAAFLKVKDDLTVGYRKKKIATFVGELADKYDTVGEAKKLKSSYGTTVTVTPGSYGWKIDEEAEIAQLTADLKGHEDVIRDPMYSQTAANRNGNDYGNSYVEVNKTAQQMFLYVDGKKVLSSDCVTGDVSRNRITHNGAYYVYYCKRNAILRGGEEPTPVDYWMPFNGGEGLHDAWWRSKFGGQIYQRDGSHGCVNLPTSVAAQVFSNVYSGFPVLVYELPGTERDPEAEARRKQQETETAMRQLAEMAALQALAEQGAEEQPAE